MRHHLASKKNMNDDLWLSRVASAALVMCIGSVSQDVLALVDVTGLE